MKKLFLLFGFMFSFTCAHPQELTSRAPAWDSIRIVTADSGSPFFYPRLLERYNNRDTSLTLQDFRCLYFGYTFQPGYEAYWISPYEKKLVEYYRKPEIREKDYGEIIRLIDLSVKENPFDLRQLNFLAYVWQMKGDTARAGGIRFAFSGVITAILSSGDGKTCATGFHVISPAHEYVLLNMFDFQFKSQALTEDMCDYMSVEKDERGIDGIYFNISRLWEVNTRSLEKKSK
jgi:hypothetical protein